MSTKERPTLRAKAKVLSDAAMPALFAISVALIFTAFGSLYSGTFAHFRSSSRWINFGLTATAMFWLAWTAFDIGRDFGRAEHRRTAGEETNQRVNGFWGVGLMLTFIVFLTGIASVAFGVPLPNDEGR